MEITKQELKDLLEIVQNLKPLVYTTKELAEALRTYPRKIDELRQEGALQGIKKGSEYIFSQKEVSEFLDRFRGCDLSNRRAIKLAVLETEDI